MSRSWVFTTWISEPENILKEILYWAYATGEKYVKLCKLRLLLTTWRRRELVRRKRLKFMKLRTVTDIEQTLNFH